jgi:PadR family transcriptional regulator, regulatory protein PadR
MALPLRFMGSEVKLPKKHMGKPRDANDVQLELVRGTLDVLILKALIWGPLHGYAVSALIGRQTDGALLVEEGTLYPALWRLEGRGLIEADWGLSENNRRAKFYRLTAAGRKRLRDDMRLWDTYAAAVNKMLQATRPPAPEVP